MARVLIAGCGYVGGALGARLAADGHEVFGLRRRPRALPDGVLPLAADLCDAGALAGALPTGVELAVYAAAAGERSEAGYRAAYVDGLRNLIEALPTASPGLRRLLFTSSTGVYHQDGGVWVDEESPTEPTHFSGRLLLEGERLLARSGVPGASVRFGGIYGPGRTRLVESVRNGQATLAPGPPLYTNRIHRDDCAGVLRHLLALPDPAPLYVGVDCEPADQATVLRWLAERLGAPAPKAAGADATGPAGRTRTSKRCSNARLLASGYAFAYPSFREGYAALLGRADGV